MVGNTSLSSKQVGSQASCRVTQPLAWIKSASIKETFVSHTLSIKMQQNLTEATSWKDIEQHPTRAFCITF